MMDRKLHQSLAKDSIYKKLQAYRVRGVLDDINRENEEIIVAVNAIYAIA